MAVVENITRHAPSGSGPGSDPSRSPEWLLVQRIVASPAFVRSALLTNFLLYVCDRKLRGKEEEITEHQIGVHALGRPDNYHPGEDNIVRNYARMLRKRLEEFFEGEGHAEELRILIPRGQYVPTFERAQAIPEAPAVAEVAPEVPEVQPTVLETLPPVVPVTATPTKNSRRNFLLGASALAGASALGLYGAHRLHANAPSQIFNAFWAQLFNPNRDCYIVTGDSGLVLVQRITGHDFSLNEYVDGTMASNLRGLTLSAPEGSHPIEAGTLHFTSTADLKVAIALDRLAMVSHATPKVRNARDMRMVDVKTSNGIFIGGPRANPWIELFAPRSNFQMKFYPVNGTDRANQSIWNKQPKPGEQQEYRNLAAAPYTTYTMVSFLPSLDDDGWSMILQGQSLSGTGAAGEFVTNVGSIVPILQNAKKPDGTIGPFEIVLETQIIGTDSPKARIVAERYETLKGS